MNAAPRLWRYFAAVTIAALFAGHLVNAVPQYILSAEPLLSGQLNSYDDKMTAKLGSYYKFTEFIQAQTLPSATLLFDARYQNRTLDPYFLFPRRLLYGGEQVLNSHPEVEYVVISENYPDYAVDGEKLMFDSQHGLIKLK